MNCIPDISKCLALCLVVLAIHCMPAKGDAIGFFYALESDLQGLKTLAHETGPSTQIGSRSIQKLQLGTHAIYAIQMGAGAVETAASAQALLSRFRCDWALSLGPAGSLSDAAETGRWYRVGRVVAWQSGKSDQTWNTDWSRFPVAHPPELLQAAPSISLASGELFISTTSERDRARATAQADAVDMNSFGLASVCANHGVPLFSWKIISDRADERAADDFRAFVAGYAGAGGRALAEIIQALPANPNDPATYPAIHRMLRGPPPEDILPGGAPARP